MNNKNEFPNLPSDCTSMLCKHLTKEVFEALKDKKTANNFTISDAINSGVENLDSGIGVYAGDEESYRLFAPLFDPIIEEYHGFTPSDKHHLQIKGIHGEHSQSEGGVYDISNKRRLGVTEVMCVQDMVDGVVELIEVEKSL